MDLGIAAWMTQRTLLRSMPMPKATCGNDDIESLAREVILDPCGADPG
jgi:hypothetical protein